MMRIALPAVLLLAVLGLCVALLWPDRGGSVALERAPQQAGTAQELADARLEAARELPAAEPAQALERESLAPSLEPIRAAPRAAPTSSGSARLVGRLVDWNGRPIAGGRVAARDADFFGALFAAANSGTRREGEATSAADGRFALEGVEAGVQRIGARASGYAPYSRENVQVPSSGQLDLGELVLGPGAILGGRVVDERGAAIEGASIRLPDEDLIGFGPESEPLALSAADGSFLIETMPLGPWTLEVAHAEHRSRSFEGTANDAGRSYGGLVFELQPGQAISGRVHGIPSDPGGTVQVRARRASEGPRAFGGAGRDQRRASVAADGSFRIAGLAPDASYDLQVELEREGGLGFGRFRGARRSTNAVARSGERDVLLEWQGPASLRFRVVDALSGEPIEDLLVSSVQGGAGASMSTVLNGPDGRVQRKHPGGLVQMPEIFLGMGATRVLVRATGYADLEQGPLQLVVGQELDLGVLRMQRVPVVEVLVRAAATGQPIEGARVELGPAPQPESRDEGGGRERGMQRARRFEINAGGRAGDAFVSEARGNEAITGPDGIARLNSLPGQRARVDVRCEGFAPARLDELELPAEQDGACAVQLVRGGSVRVQALSADGQPLPGARIERRPDEERPAFGMLVRGGDDTRVADEHGSALFEHLAPGEQSFRLAPASSDVPISRRGGFTLRMDSDAPQADWTAIAVDDGGAHELALSAPPEAVLRGRVLEAGQPLVGAELRLEEADQPNRPRIPRFGPAAGATTDGEGRFELRGLTPGKRVLVVDHRTRAMSSEQELELREGDNECALDLDVAIVQGTVRDPQGEPIAGARVRAERGGGVGNVRMVAVMLDSESGPDVVDTDGNAPSGLTDAEGRYELRGLPSGVALRIAASGRDAQPATSEEFELDRDEVRRKLDLELAPAGTIELEVVDGEGKPAGMCMAVATHAEGGEPQRSVVGPSGRSKLEGLRPGRWTVSLTRFGPSSGEAAQPQTAEVKTGAAAQLKFELL
jgi:protocatechuate 3,4-dioxygenase beta subunit